MKMSSIPLERLVALASTFAHAPARGPRWRSTALLALGMLSFAIVGAVQAQENTGPGSEDDTPVTLDDFANPDRPRGAGSAEGPISIDFDDVPLGEVVAAIGVQTGRNFEVDAQLLNQKVTIYAHHDVPAELAMDILEAVLSSKNFVMVETVDGNLIRIIPRAQASTGSNDKLTIYKGSLKPISGFDRQAIHIINVKYADATEVADLLQKVGSQSREISVYQQTLIIKDTADGVRNMLTVLEEVDIPGTGTAIEIFTLEYTRAEALAQQITDVLITDGGSGGSPSPQRPTAVRRAPTRPTPVPGQAAVDVVGASEQTLRLVPDERLNALITVASEGLMDQVKYLISQLDTPTPFESNNMHYVALLNADAEAVVEALDAITSTGSRQGTQQGAPTGEIQPFEKDIVISFYEDTNALLVLATPQDFQKLKEMIDNLDVPRRQVSVEAVIMEVSINDGTALSVESALLDEDDFFALSNAANIANAIALGPASLAGAGGTIGILGSTTTFTNPVTGEDITTRTVPFLIRALEEITDTEVLSRPNLLAIDNTEAEITVGQEIPVIASVSDVDDRTGFSSRGQVNRRDVGVRLSVTPQINEGEYVSMEVEVEVSAAVESNVGIDPNEVGATIQQSLVHSEVVVGNGQTGIIGGLIRESRGKSVSQVPLLGDLPLLGWLFRSRGLTRSKQNLVILLTPQVVMRAEDFNAITAERMEDYYTQNLDGIFEEGGFMKKIRAKRDQRRKRPTDQYKPKSSPTKNFGGSVSEN